ncbi:hypothetical protein Tco_0908579 [Tanacetum coccineum]|uniref:Uncharacterized protein n=1 Tax=Tanacetum coccineum TaxID=301880 RepID=A0ABQ5CTZ4_9ASTR
MLKRSTQWLSEIHRFMLKRSTQWWPREVIKGDRKASTTNDEWWYGVAVAYKKGQGGDKTNLVVKGGDGGACKVLGWLIEVLSKLARRTDYESWSQRIRLYCRGKENGLQILQSIDQGPFELGTTRNTLGTTPEGGVLLGPERPRLKETNHEQLYAYLKQHEKHAAQDRLFIERITPATNDQLAFVSTVQPHAQSSHVQSHQYPSSSINPQLLQYPQFPEMSQINFEYTQTDEILDNITKQMALLTQSFRATLPQTNNQLRTSSNTRNQATIQDGRLFVHNVQGHQESESEYFLGKWNYTQPKRPQNFDYFKDKMLLMQAQENGAVLDEEELLFCWMNRQLIDAFEFDFDDEPTAQSYSWPLSTVGSANPQGGQSNASILSEVHILENAIDHSVTQSDEHEIHNKDKTCASFALNNVCVSSDNDAFVSHDPIATELKIYKEQVAIYEQHAKFELTEREQRMDDQMRMLIQNRINRENAKKELHSVKLKEHFDEVQKSLVTEVRAMKVVFEQLEAEVDQKEIDLKSGEIERKNLLITNENLIAECLSKDVFYTATDSVLNVSRFSDMHDAFTIAQKRIADLESENFNLRNKIQNDDHDSMIKHFSKLEVEHFNLQLKYQNLKELEDTNVERTIGYLSLHLQPLQPNTLRRCRISNRQHVLKTLKPHDKQNASTNSLRKKGVTFVEPCETSTHNTPPQVEHQKINSTNVPGIPSTGVKVPSHLAGQSLGAIHKKDRTCQLKCLETSKAILG